MWRFFAFCLCLSVSFVSQPLRAQTETSEHWSERLIFFVGLDGGYSRLNAGGTPETSKDGIHLAPHLVASYQWRHFTADLGGGWFYNRMKGDASSPPVSETVITKAGYLEKAFRWRAPLSFELGLVHHLQFGTELGYSSIGRDYKAVSLLGAQALYQWETRFPIRARLSALTDLNISGRQSFLLLAGLQLGLRAREWQQKPSETPLQPSRPSASDFASIESVEEDQTRIRLQASWILFATGERELNPEAKPRLRTLADFLRERNQEWAQVEVVGHTDRRGSFEFNQKLSEDRAESVRQALVEFGVNPDKIVSRGMSFSQPRVAGDSLTAYEMNRRVEVLVKGLRVDEDFVRVIEEMNREIVLP